MELQNELLHTAKSKFQLSQRVCEAFNAIPRHKFLDTFSIDFFTWVDVTPETMELVYADTTLLLYKNGEYISTISQPSFVLKMLELLDLRPGMKVFELGSGSGWNAALMGHLVGKDGLVKSFEIIPEMAQQAQKHVAQFDLPQVQVVQGDALQLIWDEEEFDRGIFTAGARDMPGILFDVIKEEGKMLFVLKTNKIDLLLVLQKKKDHFVVLEKIPCQFVKVTGPTLDSYFNDLSDLLFVDSEITIWPQGTMNLGKNVISGRDMVFKWE